ncbi:MAG TPA: urea ABC transporter permease subunit UrtB [Cellvibrionaceae bacterium]
MNYIFACGRMFACWLLALGCHAEDFADLAKNLNADSFTEKSAAATALYHLDDPRVLPTLKAMQEGNLYWLPESGLPVIGKEVGDQLEIQSSTDQTSLGLVDKTRLEKIKINNGLRRELRGLVAGLELSAKDPSIREQSARNLIKNPDETLRAPLVVALDQEKNNSIKEIMQVALASIDMGSTDAVLRKTAVATLAEALQPEAIALLEKASAKNEAGQYVHEDTEFASSSEAALKAMQAKVDLFKFLENCFFGISLGSVLLLAAIGLAITFGVMGVINMAHGEMIMLGAYTTFAIQQLFPNWMEASILIAIPAAFLVSGGVGVLIERTIIRHLYGRPLETLLATFGVSLFLQQVVRTYRANNVAVVAPDWMSGMWQINGALSLTYNRMYIILFSVLVLALLAFLLRKTYFGLQMRAVTQNRAMANSMGIRSGWVDALTFGLGSGIAGIAGVALSQITNVGPNMGQQYIIDSFMVVVFGGVGNLLGTLFAALSLGVVNKFLEPFAGAVLGKIMVLVFIILFIQWRPRGLFALKGRFVED